MLQVTVIGDIPCTIRETMCFKYHQEHYRDLLRGGREKGDLLSRST